MRLFKIIFIQALLLSLLLSANLFAQDNSTDNNGEKQLYTCGMHPHIISDEPGYCPICEMKLTPKRSSSTSSSGVTIDPVTKQNMGLVTSHVRSRKLSKTLHAFGKVDFAEPAVYRPTIKFKGWIEKMYVNYVGEKVQKGQPLLEIYSPELVTAQKELIILKNSSLTVSQDTKEFVELAVEKLSNWDISREQIVEILNKGEVIKNIIIRSPSTGIVTKKFVESGQEVNRSTVLFEIADVSTVWIRAFIYEQDLPFVNLNQDAEISFPNLSNLKLKSKVSYVSSFLNNKKQIEIRLNLDNADNMLKPEMYAEVNLFSESDDEVLVIPRKAIIHSGIRTGVYITVGEDSYKYQAVEIGAVGDDDLIEITEGLTLDDVVVTSGQFLIDSETRLSEAIGMSMGHNHSEMSMASAKSPAKSEEDQSSMDKMDGMDMAKATVKSEIYTCPMPSHFNVLQYGEGKCPECNMDLVPVSQTDNKEVYVCPMEEDQVVQNKPGSCPKCNMDLVKLKGKK